MDDSEDDEIEPEMVDFTAALAVREQGGERYSLEMGPFTIFTMIGALQLVTRHPEIVGPNRAAIMHMIRDLSLPFQGMVGEEIIKRGGHPEWDVPGAGQEPQGLQLDLLTALLRLAQIHGEREPEHYLWDRVMTCDLPRLLSYLDGRTIKWMKEDPDRNPAQAHLLGLLPLASSYSSQSRRTSAGPPPAGNEQ